MSVVLAGAAAPLVVSCPGLVNLTGGKSGLQERYGEGSPCCAACDGITGSNDDDANMSGLMWSICLYHNTFPPCICIT